MGDPALDPGEVIALAGRIDEDFAQRIEFLLELDRLKTVIRRSRLVDQTRFENTAEHSWHLALAVLVLAERADIEVDRARAVAMVLVHDIVEIDAGDTFAYDAVANGDKAEREQRAAERIFGLAPEGIGAELRDLWEEYEARQSPTARFAYACDRLQPILLNASTGGRSWRENGIRAAQVEALNRPIELASADAWRFVESLIDAGVKAGALAPE